MSVFQTEKMLYRNFGNSGLRISVISVGNMINYKPETYEEDKKIIEVCLRNGINHFDTAELYAAGQAESTLGRILKELNVCREDVVIATKIKTDPDADINSTSTTNRKHIKEGLAKALGRLQLDYVDIIYAHFPDRSTPLQEICRAFHEVIEKGLAFYWATSNWDADAVFEALAICERLNLHKPVGTQNEYSLLARVENEIEYESLFTKYNYGLIAWSPLAGGFLTGRYLDGLKEEELCRFTDKNSSFPLQIFKRMYYTPHATEKNIKSLAQLKVIADEMGCKLVHLALAWVIKYSHTDSALIGVRTAAQLEEDLGCLDVLGKLTPELQRRINKIIDTTPTPKMDFKAWKPYDPVRPVAKE